MKLLYKDLKEIQLYIKLLIEVSLKENVVILTTTLGRTRKHFLFRGKYEVLI